VTTARQLTGEAWACIESGDMTRLATMFHPDAELTTSAGGGRGRQYVVDLFTRHRQGYPDIRHRVLDSIETGDGQAVALRLEFQATHLGALRGPFGVLEPTGRHLVWAIVRPGAQRRGADHLLARPIRPPHRAAATGPGASRSQRRRRGPGVPADPSREPR